MKKFMYCLFFTLFCTFSLPLQAAELTLYATSLGQADLRSSAKTQKVMVESLTVEAVAQELSKWTGLNFSINDFTLKGTQITIDWSTSSTLLSGTHTSSTQKAFTFKDIHSLRWFMLDSLYITLLENFELEAIYFTQDGGKTLRFDKLSPVNEFPLQQVYKGSNFYFLAYKENTAAASIPSPTVIDDALLFNRTKGRWRIQKGQEFPMSLIVLDGLGGFSSYTTIGTLKMKGYLEFKHENNQNIFEMYGLDKKYLMNFTIESENQLHLKADKTYIFNKE